MNILFTCAGRRTYLLKYFREQLAGDGLIIATDMQMSAPALSAADVAVQVPAVYAADYVDKTIAVCKQYKVDAVLSLNDLDLPILAAHRDRFDEIGVKLIVSDQRVIDVCFDKYKTAQFIESIGLRSPKTFVDFKVAVSAIENNELKFPLVLKPRWGSGSIGIEFVKNMDELRETYAHLVEKIKETCLAEASVGDEYILIQEKIEGPEYGLDVLNDLEGNNVGVSVKRKLAMRAGETDKAITEYNETVRSMGMKLGRELRHIANLDVDILERDGCYYVLELNPRFGGGFPFSYEAGVNMPKAIIEWIKGNKVDPGILAPQYGKRFAKCDYLVSVR